MLGPGEVGLLDKKEGGFAEVLILANDAGEPTFAFKIPKEGVDASESVVAEVNALARLPAHSHVVEVAGYSKSEIGPGILLSYYPSNLRSAMLTNRQLKAKLVLVEQILQGLQHIHTNGILHLDLKPENVLISASGSAAISDFGISKLFAKPDLKKNPTLKVSLPSISGTLLYMAPEQLANSEVSIKTDIFSFGVLLYELVLGRLPWSADTVQDYAKCILYAREQYSFIERLRVPDWLRNLISACLAKAPSARPTVETLLHSLVNKGFHKVVALSDEDVAVREVNRASVLSQAGKSEEAMQILGGVLRLNPWNLTARTNIAELMFSAGRIDDAIASARLSLELAPWGRTDTDSPEVLLLNLAFYLLSKDPRGAYRVTSHALERFPDNWELLHNHAEACRIMLPEDGSERTALIAEGLEHAEAALRSRSNDEALRVTYAGLLWKSGDRARAVPYLNQLMKDVGDHNAAARMLHIDALIDDGNLDVAEQQIEAMQCVPELRKLLEHRQKTIAARRQRNA